MKSGFVLPNMEPFLAIEMAQEAEAHGWDVFCMGACLGSIFPNKVN
jgi:hypothetical protein